ncbi:cleavage stimulation factor subunit 1-like [Stylophora pistillata]|uniref:cleavage stimulation factor subunit 1-like n=1 Tax=Stylophora pistillata TaxID=50429 RepID=UPI000C041012|nr:cleavage stimulation factor subunit 1-like [Stylophora pistillata]
MADGLKQRENLYKLMISQLRYDGFDAIANNLAKVVNIISACPPMARLYEVVNLGIQAETEGTRPEPTVLPGLTPSVETSRGVDLEYEPEGKEVNGEWQNSTTDESFMSNLELQKVDQDCESEPEEKPDDSPSASMVLNHILRITSDKKFAEPPQTLKPAAAAES